MVLTVPGGKRVRAVRELISGDTVTFSQRKGQARITVQLTPDTPARVFRWDLVDQTDAGKESA